MSVLDQSVLPQSSSFVFRPNPCPTSFNNNVSSPVCHNQNMISFRTSVSNSNTNTVTIRHDTATSNTSSGSTPPFNGLQVLGHSHSSRSSGQRHIIPEASNNIVSNVTMGRYVNGDLMGSRIGLALFGICSGNRALFKSIQEESGCTLLYIVEDCIQDLESAFSADVLANTRVLRGQDADIVLNDQWYGYMLSVQQRPSRIGAMCISEIYQFALFRRYSGQIYSYPKVQHAIYLNPFHVSAAANCQSHHKK